MTQKDLATEVSPLGPILRAVQVKRDDVSSAGIKIWTLDFPAHDRLVDISLPELTLQGWVLWVNTSEDLVHLVVESGGAVIYEKPFNSKRPDVVERVLGEPSAEHKQLCCGFQARIPTEKLVTGFRVGVKVGECKTVWLAHVGFGHPMQVLEGTDGWLFLDNDSNHSVDQYTGKRLLSAEELRCWREYLSGTYALSQRIGLRSAILVAPSKEEVLRHRYPHTRASTTVLDLVCALADPAWNVLDMAPVLRAHSPPEACFKKTDTHWTDRGAMLATLAVLPSLGIADKRAQALFSTDEYEFRNEVGDLGSKLLPVRSALTEFLRPPSNDIESLFDNKLPNIGRVIVYENIHALYAKKLLIFGASSGYPMLKYLKRIFERVVFVHSAAQVDVDVVEYERPDALLLQSNGRFLVQPPSLNFSLNQAVCIKLNETSAAMKNAIRQILEVGSKSASDNLYRSMLLKAFDSR